MITSSKNNAKSLIVIDRHITDWKSLMGGIADNTTLLVLDPLRDGLTQISEAVANSTNIDAIHIISHGSAESLLLGSSILNINNLGDYQTQLTSIGNALSINGDILLYGCDVAQGEADQFIQALAQITGADVAASDDLTGASALGGDWILEKTVGTIESQTIQSTYNDVLALPNASQLFNLALMPEEKSVAGGEQAGMIRTMADFSKAAYNLVHPGATEYVDINDNSPHATEAYNDIINHNWTPLNFSSVPPTLDRGAIQYGMLNDGFFINGNAAACVARCGDAIVLSFRGTNDNGKDGVVNPYDPNNSIHPDVDQWTDMPSYYALLQPLISAFDAYVANTANGVSKVYVTGHSMGGTMALEYMSHHSGNQYQAITFAASPFGDTFFFVPFRKDYAPDSRITQIEIAKDTIPMLFDERVGVSVGNTRPGELISFAGNQTLTVDMTNPSNHISAAGGFGVDYYGITANHSMDYYRQITDSVDADSWTKILAGTGTQTVLLGGQQVLGTDNFIVDGQLSGTNTSVSNGNDQLASIDFKVIYGGKGNDILLAGINSTQLLGGVGNDILLGNMSNDTLNGGKGIDSMTGGTGDDTYYVDHISDVIVEKLVEGLDIVNSTVSYTLSANIEKLVLTGTAFINGLGNADNNDITGNISNNILNGQAGADTMTGGMGNDSYYVDNKGDMVIEEANEGNDSVWSALGTYILTDNIESIGLLAGAFSGTGNTGNNTLIGNTASNTLNGGAGDDKLDGGVSDVYNPGVIDTLNGDAGNDTFLVRGFFGAGNYDGGLDNDTIDFSQADAYTAGRRTTERSGVKVNLATFLKNIPTTAFLTEFSEQERNLPQQLGLSMLLQNNNHPCKLLSPARWFTKKSQL